MTTIARLLHDLSLIEDGLAELVGSVPVRWFDRGGGGILFIVPEYEFEKLSPAQEHSQLNLKRTYDRWIERVNVLFAGAPEDIQRKLKEAEDVWRTWLEFRSNWSARPEVDSNVAKVHQEASRFRELLQIFAEPNAGIVVVPDTNALLRVVEPTSYRATLGIDTFTFLLLPTVLRELDELKVLHRNPEVREKAERVITRIKGWRKQGPLLQGVTIDKTITVVAVAEEPSVKSTLSWLDPENRDDRIIAAVIALQVARPMQRLILVTGDINLQNKADAASIETEEPPTA